MCYNATLGGFGTYIAGNITAGSTGYYDLELLPVDGKVTPAQIELDPGFYVIAANVDGTYYGLPSAFADDTKASGSPVTVTDGTVTASDAAGFVVYIHKNEDGYMIFNGTDFLAYSGSGTNMDISSDAYTWKIFRGENGAYHVASATSTNRGLNYRTSTYNAFGIYDESNVSKEEYYDVLLLPIVGSVGFDDNSGDESSDVPTTGNSYVAMKIITGEGEVYLLKSGHTGVYGNAATEKGVVKYNWVDAGQRVTLVIKPAEGYRVACIERDVARLVVGNGIAEGTNAGYLFDPNLNGYVYTFTVDQDSLANYFRVSFLPGQAEGGYIATQITGWEDNMSGEYVITGLQEPEHYDDNKHSNSTTYLLYGDSDTAKDDAYEAIGRKSSALQLASVGVALNASVPYEMSSLNRTHIMHFEKVGEFYTIRLFGVKDEYYIAAGESGSRIYTATTFENNDYALWDITYLGNGALAIKNVGHANAGTERFLMFNNASANLQFRCYDPSLSEASYPVVYEVSNVNYRVSLSVNDAVGGSIHGYNNTSGMSIASDSYQPKDSDLTFTVTPQSGWKIESVILTESANGAIATYDVPVTDPENGFCFDINALGMNIQVDVTFAKIGPVSFTVEYFINNTKAATASINAISPYALQTDGTVTDTDGNTYDLANLIVGETKYNLANLSFDGGSCGADIYADLNALMNVKSGDTVKAYFSTSEVNRTKTVEEITDMTATDGTHGGLEIEDDDRWFTDENTMDEHGNVGQSYRVTMSVGSDEKIEEAEKGGNTDVILVLDGSASMYPISDVGSESITYLTEAVQAFTAEVLKNNNEGNNKIALVQYDTWARAWDGSKALKMLNYMDTNSDYGLVYSRCYMDTYVEVMDAFNQIMIRHTESDSQGATNTMGGLHFAEIMAGVRPTATDRDLLVIMFTDGVPTCRYSTSDMTHSESNRPFDDQDASATSAWELLRAIEAGEDLRSKVNTYKNCESTIVNVALLNSWSLDEEDERVCDYIMSDVATYKWNEMKYSGYNCFIDVTGDSPNSDGTWLDTKYYVKSTPWADKYMKITGRIGADTLSMLYGDVVYEYIPEKNIVGCITDVIPADFELTEQSRQTLLAEGCTITDNSDGTTTIKTADIIADAEGKTYTYDIVYTGSGCGAVYTNDVAAFAYKTLLEDDTATAYFPMPAVAVVPATVDDCHPGRHNLPVTIDVLSNDLFEELRVGGYTLGNVTVTLTDENGNPVDYNDAIEQDDCGFDATVDPATGIVTYYTEKCGEHVFYYVVSATLTATDGAQTVVRSRATKVTVQTQAHDPQIVTVEATCTTEGQKTNVCSLCSEGEIVETIPPLGHDYKESGSSAPTCTEFGFTTYTCTRCGDEYNVLGEPGYGHDTEFVNNGEKHIVSCHNCDLYSEEPHEFIDGCCICGAVEMIEPAPDADLKFNMDISVGAEMVVNYNFLAGVVGKYEDFYLEVSKNVADGDPVITTYGISEGHNAMAGVSNPVTGAAIMYNAAYTGINAKEMGDNFATTLYAIDADGKLYRGETVVSSIRDFLISKIEDDASIPEMKTMAVDMLKYGAAAQLRFHYDEDDLVTNGLSEEQIALGTEAFPGAVDHSSVTGSGVNIATSITVNSKVELNLSCVAAGQADPAAVKCLITDEEGKVLAQLPTVNIGGVMYSAMYDNVGAKEMRKIIIATFVDADGNAISKSAHWSVESYVAQTWANPASGPNDIDVASAMLMYGDSVAAYLEASGQ